MHVSKFYVGLALSSLSGCLWLLAVTPYDFTALAWVAAIPMLLAIDRAPTFGRALLLGWWAGVVESAGGFYWLIETMQRFADFPWLPAALILFVFCAARALIFVVATALICAVRRRRRYPMTLLAAPALVIGELVIPQIFPCGQWISQAWQIHVIQIAELTGPLGVTALLMVVNGALYDLGIDRRRALLPASIAAALLAASLIYGSVRISQVERTIAAAPHVPIGLVQPNFSYTTDGVFSREEALRQLAALQAQSQRLEHAGAKLIVWSEGSYPVPIPRDFTVDFDPDSLAMIRRDIHVPTLIGALTYRKEDDDDAYNSAMLLNSSGTMTGRYDKVRLLAFGEYIPGIEYFPWLRQLLPPGAGRFIPGPGPAVMPWLDADRRTWQLSPLVCYEDLLPSFIRGAGKLTPNLLVNLTSDSWFGAKTEPWEHLALAVFASVELRVSMVRSVNSGISALIDPTGRVVSKTYAHDPYRSTRPADGIVVDTPMMPATHTFYVTAGNWFAYLCIALFVGLGWRMIVEAREPRQRR